jgi:DNA-binding transcriptional LysR family regulator
MLWCAPSHPLARKKVIRPDDLRSVALVAAGRDQEISIAQVRSGAPEGSSSSPVEVADNIAIALGTAAQGLAAMLAPAYVAAMAHPLGLEMRPISGPKVIRQICLYRPALRSIPPAADGFGAFLVDWVKRWHATDPSLRARNAKGARVKE